jgi:membrane-associated phospholipid phosphatase
LPFIFKNLFNKKCIALCIFLPILLILTVAFGRMAGGYHFLSDVSTSLIICFVFSSLFFYLFFYNQNLSLIIENKIIKNNLFTNGIIILLMLGLLVYIYFA